MVQSLLAGLPDKPTPTPEQRKDIASTESTEAGTERTTTLTPLEAQEKRLTIEEKQRKAAEAAAAAEAAKRAADDAAQKHRDQIRNFLEDIQRTRKLLANPLATGPAAQLTGGIWTTPAQDLSALLASLKNPIVLEAMRAARAGSKVGATGFGALSGKELDLLASSLGSLRQGQSPAQLLETLNRIDTSTRRLLAYNAGYDPNKPEGAMLVGLPFKAPSQELPEPRGGELKAGEWSTNPELAGLNAAVTSMIKGGRSAEEIRQWMNEYQPGAGDRAQNLEANIDYWRQTKKDPRVDLERVFTPSESKISALGEGPVGAYTAGAADQLLFGSVDELSGDRERTSAVMRGLRDKYGPAYTAGQVSGGVLSALVPEGIFAKFGMRATPLLQGVVGNALYGAGSAEPGERLSNAGYEALMTPITNIFGQAAGKAIGVPLRGASGRLRLLADRYGINLTPGQMGGGSRFERFLTGLPNVGSQIRARRNETLDQFNQAAFDEGLAPIGVRVSAPGQVGIAEAQKAVNKAYDDALEGIQLTPDTAFAQQVRGRAYNDLGKLRGDAGPDLQEAVDEIFARHADPSGTISGKNLQSALGDLQKLKIDYMSDTRWARRIAPQLDEISDAYSGLLERQFPENYDMFKQANTAYRNVSILEKAVDTATEGDIFNPANLRSATRQGTIRFGGKKASARGDRPFNTLVMSSLKTVPSKFDDTSMLGQVLTPLATGAGVGGVSLLQQPEEGSDRGEDEGSGILSAPLAYGLAGSLLAAAPYSRFGNRAMSSMLRGSRTPRQQALGSLIENYLPAAIRGAERGYTSEPGIPSPREQVPYLDRRTQELIEKTPFAEPPKEDEGVQLIDKTTGRPVTQDKETGQFFYADTGEKAEGVTFAHGGLVFSTGRY